MIKITCDMCGKEIFTTIDRVDVNLDFTGVITRKFRDRTKHLCITCANTLLAWMDAQLEKGGAE